MRSKQKISCVPSKRICFFQARDFLCSKQEIPCVPSKRLLVFQARDFWVPVFPNQTFRNLTSSRLDGCPIFDHDKWPACTDLCTSCVKIDAVGPARNKFSNGMVATKTLKPEVQTSVNTCQQNTCNYYSTPCKSDHGTQRKTRLQKTQK